MFNFSTLIIYAVIRAVSCIFRMLNAARTARKLLLPLVAISLGVSHDYVRVIECVLCCSSIISKGGLRRCNQLFNGFLMLIFSLFEAL